MLARLAVLPAAQKLVGMRIGHKGGTAMNGGTVFRVAVLLMAWSVLPGCFVWVPYPLLESLPQESWRTVKVLDAGTGQPIPDAVVKGLLLPESRTTTFWTQGPAKSSTDLTVAFEKDRKGWYIPELSNVYDLGAADAVATSVNAGDGVYRINPQLIGGWGMLDLIWVVTQGDMSAHDYIHQACISVSAPNHLSVVVFGVQPYHGGSPPPGAGVKLKNGTLEVRLPPRGEKAAEPTRPAAPLPAR